MAFGTSVAVGVPPDVSGLLPGGLGTAEAADSRVVGEAGEVRARGLAFYGAGLRREQAGDGERALVLYREALRLDPGHWQLAVRLAEHEGAAGRWDEAMALLEGAVQGAPDRPDALLALSAFCFRHAEARSGWRDRAVTAVEETVARFPGLARSHAHLVQLHLRLGNREAAEAALERALARDEGEARYWLGLAASAMALWPPDVGTHRERVLSVFRRAQALAPDDPVVIGTLADFFAMHDGMEEAVDLYRALVGRRPDDLMAREKLARVLALTDRREEAMEAWQAVLRIDPQHEAAHRALARHFGQVGDRESSVRHRAEALRWGRGETLGEALGLVRDMLQTGLALEALPVLERAEFNAPASPEPPYLAALVHQAAGDWPRALAAFERAASVAAADERMAAQFLNDGFYFDWALAASGAGRGELAESKFRDSIARVPAGSPERAAKSYNGLAYLWIDANERLDEAAPLIQRALKIEADNPAYLDTLGWYHFRKGEFDKAVEVLGQAEAASPQPVAEISDHRAQALWALGRRDEAAALLDEVVRRPDATEAMKSRLAEWRAAGR